MGAMRFLGFSSIADAQQQISAGKFAPGSANHQKATAFVNKYSSRSHGSSSSSRHAAPNRRATRRQAARPPQDHPDKQPEQASFRSMDDLILARTVGYWKIPFTDISPSRGIYEGSRDLGNALTGCIPSTDRVDAAIIANRNIPHTLKPAASAFIHLGHGAAKAPGETVKFFGMAPVAVESVIRHPNKYVQTAVPGLIYTGENMVQSAKDDPAEFIGLTAGTILTSKGMGKAIKSPPIRPAVQTANFEGAAFKSLGVMRTSKFIDQFTPLLTKGSGQGIKKLNFGTPDISAQVDRVLGTSATGYAPTNPLESAIILKTLGPERAKIDLGLAVRKHTQHAGINPKQITDTTIDVVKEHSIPNPNEVATSIIAQMKKHDATLYGSTIQYAAGKQLKVPGLARVPRDFDVMVQYKGKFATDMLEAINTAAKKKVVSLDETQNIITKSGEKIFDIHAKDLAPTKVDLPSPPSSGGEDYISWGMKVEPHLKTMEGTDIPTLSEQGSRKLSGSTTYTALPRTLVSNNLQVSGHITPTHAGRIKDIPGFYFVENVAIAGMKGSKNPLKWGHAAKASTNLDAWLETWGSDVATQTRQNYQSLAGGGLKDVPLAYDMASFPTKMPSPGLMAAPTTPSPMVTLPPPITIASPAINTPKYVPPDLSSLGIHPSLPSPDISSPSIKSPAINTPKYTSPDLSSLGIRPSPPSQGIASPRIKSPKIPSPAPSSPGNTSPRILTPVIPSPGITSPRIKSPKIPSPAPSSPGNSSPRIPTPVIPSPSITPPVIKYTPPPLPTFTLPPTPPQFPTSIKVKTKPKKHTKRAKKDQARDFADTYAINPVPNMKSIKTTKLPDFNIKVPQFNTKKIGGI